ncbi:MAG: rRNA pseudouridine synthase [Candidatus Omnitrophica bacterium]|nr:rRNA pseudouridine synthase [Candidatus Omnitrophota bacterium]
MRLQVFLSKAGVCSRRSAVDIIRSGKARVNNRKILEPSFKINPAKDIVFLGSKKILLKEKVYIMMNKPKGVTTTKKDRFAKRTVMDLLPRRLSHLNPVGRLDKDTTGLLLLTNDGELINRLTHPRYNIEKLYEARLNARLKDDDRVVLERGLDLDGERTLPCRIQLREKSNLEIVLHEGKKRQIRRIFSKMGYKVLDLKRSKEGSLAVAGLGEGRWRALTEKELRGLP